jgi:hypothetical protein
MKDEKCSEAFQQDIQNKLAYWVSPQAMKEEKCSEYGPRCFLIGYSKQASLLGFALSHDRRERL